MGRLPETFAGQRIAHRVPFTMPGTLVIGSAVSNLQFPTATFMQTEDKPFEIHRMIPRVIAVDASNNPATGVNTDTMLRLVSLQLQDLGKDQFLTKQAVTLINFVKGTTEKTWEFADPYYLRKSENIIVNASSVTYPAVLNTLNIQVQLTFEGFLVVIAPPSDRR